MFSESGSVFFSAPILLNFRPKPEEMGKCQNGQTESKPQSGEREKPKAKRIPSCKAIKRQERKLKRIKENKGRPMV